MSILFNKVQKRNPMDPSAAKKWYPVLKRIKQVKEKEVAKQIADETTLNPKEAEMALSQLEKVLLSNLLASNSVQLGDWGSIHIKCNGKPGDTKDEVTAKNIVKLNVRVTINQSFIDRLNAAATYIFAESLQSDAT
jgi:Bacterial DNA-binding protein.